MSELFSLLVFYDKNVFQLFGKKWLLHPWFLNRLFISPLRIKLSPIVSITGLSQNTQNPKLYIYYGFDNCIFAIRFLDSNDSLKGIF